MELKLRPKRKAYSTLTTKEAAEIVSNNIKVWKPVLKKHEEKRTCTFCGSDKTLFNSNETRKCEECLLIYRI